MLIKCGVPFDEHFRPEYFTMQDMDSYLVVVKPEFRDPSSCTILFYHSSTHLEQAPREEFVGPKEDESLPQPSLTPAHQPCEDGSGSIGDRSTYTIF